MPNIELHGFGLEVGAVAGQISKHLHPSLSPDVGDVVLAICKDFIVDLGGKNRPYLRIVGTNAAELQQIAGLLKPLNRDMELLLLHAFIPAET